MAVGFGAVSAGTANSGVGTTTWTHDTNGDRAAVVFVTCYGATSNIGTKVTCGGVTMQLVGTAAASSGENGTIAAFFLDNVAQGASTSISMIRTNNATVTFPWSISFTALGQCETAGLSQQSNSSIAASGETNIDDGSPGSNSLRVSAEYTGNASPLSAAASSIGFGSADQTAFGSSGAYEAVAGQGSRPVGYATGVTDDLAVVAFAVRELQWPPDVIMAPMQPPLQRPPGPYG